MALPQGIFESFQENPGTDLDDTTGASVLDTMNENSPLFKILGIAHMAAGPAPIMTYSATFTVLSVLFSIRLCMVISSFNDAV